MANENAITKIQLKTKTSEVSTPIPSLAQGEPLFNTNDDSLYIGNKNGENNIKFYNADTVDQKINDLDFESISGVITSVSQTKGQINATAALYSDTTPLVLNGVKITIASSGVITLEKAQDDQGSDS